VHEKRESVCLRLQRLRTDIVEGAKKGTGLKLRARFRRYMEWVSAKIALEDVARVLKDLKQPQHTPPQHTKKTNHQKPHTHPKKPREKPPPNKAATNPPNKHKNTNTKKPTTTHTKKQNGHEERGCSLQGNLYHRDGGAKTSWGQRHVQNRF